MHASLLGTEKERSLSLRVRWALSHTFLSGGVLGLTKNPYARPRSKFIQVSGPQSVRVAQEDVYERNASLG